MDGANADAFPMKTSAIAAALARILLLLLRLDIGMFFPALLRCLFKL